jgi:hypothetical protein
VLIYARDTMQIVITQQGSQIVLNERVESSLLIYTCEQIKVPCDYDNYDLNFDNLTIISTFKKNAYIYIDHVNLFTISLGNQTI